MGPSAWDQAKRSFFVQCPSGNSRSGGAVGQGAVAKRHEAVIVCDTEKGGQKRRNRGGFTVA